jgi:hypothetical protein
MNIPDDISESLETIFWVKKLEFFNADAGEKHINFNKNLLFPFPSLASFTGIRGHIFQFKIKAYFNIPYFYEMRKIYPSYKIFELE